MTFSEFSSNCVDVVFLDCCFPFMSFHTCVSCSGYICVRKRQGAIHLWHCYSSTPVHCLSIWMGSWSASLSAIIIGVTLLLFHVYLSSLFSLALFGPLHTDCVCVCVWIVHKIQIYTTVYTCICYVHTHIPVALFGVLLC